MNINRLSRHLLYGFSVITITSCCGVAQKNQDAAPTVPSSRTNEATTVFMSTLTGTPAVSAPRCQPPGYPATIHYVSGDNFGDGYISRIPIEDVSDKSQEEIMRLLVTQWLEHYKSQTKGTCATIKDYAIGLIVVLDSSCDPFF